MEPYYVRLGIAIDECLNVLLLNGRPDQTISQHASAAQTANKRWGCILCKILGVLIEPDHCAKAVGPNPTSTGADLRSLIAMILVIASLYGMEQAVSKFIHWLI